VLTVTNAIVKPDPVTSWLARRMEGVHGDPGQPGFQDQPFVPPNATGDKEAVRLLDMVHKEQEASNKILDAIRVKLHVDVN
jgi:hypothetical protein